MLYSLLRPFLFFLNADKAHHSTISFAKFASDHAVLQKMAHGIYHYESDLLRQEFWGLHFANPVGLAAGFDKNGLALRLLSELGFGFLEVGSITAGASDGNPLPRAFRLPADHSLINRMGLNNDGAYLITERLKKISLPVPLGVNIAKTNDPKILGEYAIEDYLSSYSRAVNVSDYLTLNISCPNTEDGKTFEEPAGLTELLSAVNGARKKEDPPLLVKFSVDLEKRELQQLVEICENRHVDGYVACNTSILRTELKTPPEKLKTIGNGGLSGRAIASKSNKIIEWIYEITKGEKPIIGVGGIDSVDAALAKIRSGADLLQVYTGLVYEGPGLIKEINRGMANYMTVHGLKTVSEIRNSQGVSRNAPTGN